MKSFAPTMMAVAQRVNRIGSGYLTAENAVGRRNELLMLAMIGPSFSLSSRALIHAGVGEELVPHALALGERFPSEQIVKVVVAVADHHGPEAGLPDAVLVPELEGMVLKTLEQRRQPAGNALIDAQLINHRSTPLSQTRACL
jgi:hypothetical protein